MQLNDIHATGIVGGPFRATGESPIAAPKVEFKTPEPVKLPKRTPRFKLGRQLARVPARLACLCARIMRANRILSLFCFGSLGFAIVFLVVVIGPRYSDPTTRLYSSKLGYSTVARKLGQPFPVSCQTVSKRPIASRLHGEGLMSTYPVQVPIVAMARILKVHAREGDRVTKGQLLVELDSRRAVVKLEACNSALKTAIAEKERTIIGSSYIAANERPELQKMRLEMAKKIVAIQEQLVEIEKGLTTQRFASKGEYLVQQVNLLTSLKQLREAEWAFPVARDGYKQSMEIADSKIDEAQLACKHRLLELEDYKVFAPCDGIIERCVIHDGEYNQDPGKPAFIVDRGLWFEARMDQTTAGRVAVGDSAVVHLEAFPNQPMTGRVARIAPVVSYDLGGPETTRPVRPLGSGAPEWPSTYAARVELEADGQTLVPGLTGFARIDSRREVLSVPIEALLARSGRSALVYVVEEGRYRPCKVVLGSVSDGWAEIRSGLDAGAVVLTDGHQVLESGDKVVLKMRDGQAVEHLAVLLDAGGPLQK